MDKDYEAIIYIRWDPKMNIFLDECGFEIPNIFDAITPNDLFLFRHDPGYCRFRHRENKYIICEILIEE